MYNYRVYNNLFWIILIKMEYRLQSMNNHMVGQTASVKSPFYIILPGNAPHADSQCIHNWKKIVFSH